MKRKKILLVDDEPDILETVRFRLELEGYEVVTAANGLEGLGAVMSQDPDLVVLDVMLPRENGYQVARTIRDEEAAGKREGRLPIILLTARDLSSDPPRERMFMDLSRADLMMYKPFEMDELVSRIQELL